ncbi:MAG: D-alanyl-D-alanine carboxypeptidase family protein, partial [Oscillospiraceae bacterium]|nr:D-alanyl-D-alanine carboxypeptidase family protein [Oscillospiraceae bacterium]
EYNWINETCAHYGFVLRYPEEKTEITEIQYESWHYRYVGQPHAFYMQQNQLCLEEYMEELQNHTIDNALEVTNWDGKVYQVYYVPAESGDSTYVMVPPDLEYMISGNNVDGFIVTVDTGVTNLDAVKEEPTTADTEESTEDAESWDAGEAETATEPEEDVDWDAETE